MRIAIITVLATTVTTTTAFAANGTPAHEPGILCWAFIGLCAAVLVGQIVPVLGLFTSLATPRTANHR